MNKYPTDSDYYNREYGPEHFGPKSNVGIKMGMVSGNRVLLDFDTAIGRAVAQLILPSTLTGGRVPFSHWVYEIVDPETGEDGKPEIKSYAIKGPDKKNIVEFRGDGNQTVVEPSIHGTGDPYRWDGGFDPTRIQKITWDELLHKIRLVVAATLIAAQMPDNGRHDYGLACAGMLVGECGLNVQDAHTVLHAAWTVKNAYVEPKTRSEVYAFSEATLEKVENGEPISSSYNVDEFAVQPFAGYVLKLWGLRKGGKKRRNPDAPTQDMLRERVLNSGEKFAMTGTGWRKYEDGIWEELDEYEVRSYVSDVLEQAKAEGVNYTEGLVSAVTRLARDKAYVRPDSWNQNKDVVVFKDGVLALNAVDAYGRNGTRDHSPEHYVTSKLPFNYDPRATCPNWYRFLRERFSPEVRCLLQEFAGICLTTDNSYEIALWLVGPPATGKSTVIEAFEAILGERADTLDISDLGERFGLARIPGKTLLTATEQPSDYIKQLNLLNKIISGEFVDAEQKFERGERVRSRAKILWGMNELPTVRQPENGIWRRIQVIEFPPRTGQIDPTLKQRILQEAPGILAWAVRGLLRLRRRGRFVIPESVQAATQEYHSENDVPRMFIEECLVVTQDATKNIKAGDLYESYRHWCARNGFSPLNRTRAGREWKRLGLEKYTSNGVRYRYLQPTQEARSEFYPLMDYPPHGSTSWKG